MKQQGFQKNDTNTLLTLITSACHELNQPLSTIKTTTELIQMNITSLQKTEREGIDPRLNLINQQVDKMARIVSHVKYLLLQDMFTDLEHINVNDVVAAAVELLKDELTTRNISIMFEPGSDIPSVRIFPYSLETAIRNIVVNAADSIDFFHTSKDRIPEPHIIVQTRLEKNSPVRGIRIDIKDKGAGIPDNIVKKLFDPFFTTKAETGNTGMGLTIAQAIVKSFNGELYITSPSSSNTVFSIFLPASGITQCNKSQFNF